jgi:hypothetical protein
MMFKKLLLLGLSSGLILGSAGITEAKDNPIQAIFKIILGGPKPRPVDGSRTGPIINCMPYSADSQPIDLYTRSPLLVWQENSSLLTIKTSSEAPESHWTGRSGTEKVQAIDKPLTAGQSYWLKLERVNGSDQPFAGRTLRVLTDAERQPHQKALVLLEKRSDSAEERAVKRLDYFANQGFWVDAIHSLYEVKQPSEGFQEGRSKLVDAWCKAAKA